jgi:glycerophosphoryl diester phosphodiesterase
VVWWSVALFTCAGSGVRGGELVAEAGGTLRAAGGPFSEFALELDLRVPGGAGEDRARSSIAIEFGRGEAHVLRLELVAGRITRAEHAVRGAGGALAVRVGVDADVSLLSPEPAGVRVLAEVGGGRALLLAGGDLLLESAFASDAGEGSITVRAGALGPAVAGARVAPLSRERLAQVAVRRDRGRSTRVIAHRGASAVAPENTLASLRLGVELGADGCEFDVQRTQDGELVLLHDDTLERTTDFKAVFTERPEGEGRVEDLRLEEIARLDAGAWKSPAYRGEKVPTLRQALAALEGESVPIVEIKPPGIGREVARVIREMGLEDRVFVQSFEEEAIKDFRAELPQVTTGLLIGERGPAAGALRAREHVRRAREAGASAVVCHYSFITPEYLDEAHGRAMVVWVYTVNDAALVRILTDMGIDGIITDVPDLALRLRAEESVGADAGAAPAAAAEPRVSVEPRVDVEPRPGLAGKRRRIEAGEVAVREIARFLSDYTGLPILSDSSRGALLEERITVTAPVAAADDGVVKALLEANRIRVSERQLEGGTRVLLLEPALESTGGEAPVSRPIVVVGSRRGERQKGAVRVREPVVGELRHGGLVLGPVPAIVRAQTDLAEGWGTIVLAVEGGVLEVEEGSRRPAELAPLRLHDIVLKVNRDPTNGPEALVEALARLQPGETFHYRLLRRGITEIVRAEKGRE